MKKLLSVFLVCSMLIVFASCGEDSADYSTAQMPIEDLCWGMSLNDAKKALDKQKIEYTEEEMEIENANAVKYLKLSDQPKMYGINIKERSVYFDKNNGLYRIAVAFDEADENKVMNAVSKEVGEFEKMKYISTPDSPVWQCESEVTLKTLEKQELLEEVERYYLEVNSEIEKSEEELEEMLCRPLTIMRVQEIADYNWILFSIDGITASSLKRIEKMGAEEYYKSEQEFQKRIEEYDEKKKNE